MNRARFVPVVVAVALAAGALVAPRAASAAIKTEVVTYKQGKVVLEGYLAYDDALQGKRPAVLVVHEWTGINDHTRAAVEKLAAAGYVAFAADIYGRGVRPATPEEAGKEAGKFKNDRKLMRARARAGLDWLAKHPRVDAKKMVAMGYCFGGTVALELARSGAPLAGVVSFHGGLSTPTPKDAKNIKGKVLVLHGGDDPFVKPEEVAAFETEMRDAGVDWQLVKYGGAVHSFTNPAAGNDKSKGAAYDEKADKRSWQALLTFLRETVG
jgi:dienelactone hydrolase